MIHKICNRAVPDKISLKSSDVMVSVIPNRSHSKFCISVFSGLFDDSEITGKIFYRFVSLSGRTCSVSPKTRTRENPRTVRRHCASQRSADLDHGCPYGIPYRGTDIDKNPDRTEKIHTTLSVPQNIRTTNRTLPLCPGGTGTHDTGLDEFLGILENSLW